MDPTEVPVIRVTEKKTHGGSLIKIKVTSISDLDEFDGISDQFKAMSLGLA